MRKVIGVMVCGFTLAACSGSASDFFKTPDFLKPSPATTALRFESVPPGAQVKVGGQTCRTPCELKLEVAELSATFALKGYESETVAVHSERSLLSSPKFAPNPVQAELRRVGASARRPQLNNDTPVAANPRGAVPAEATTSSEVTTSVPPRASTYGAVQ
jgi:PEGA domain